jgi:tRNA A37 threonylcarbamoyltransferase TsaD
LAGEYKPPTQSLPSRGEVATKKPLFPRVWLVKKEFNFSFSGLKSAVKREVDRRITEN